MTKKEGKIRWSKYALYRSKAFHCICLCAPFFEIAFCRSLVVSVGTHYQFDALFFSSLWIKSQDFTSFSIKFTRKSRLIELIDFFCISFLPRLFPLLLISFCIDVWNKGYRYNYLEKREGECLSYSLGYRSAIVYGIISIKLLHM